MTAKPINPLTNDIIAAAWADDISFDKIRQETGLPEKEVIAIMRKNLKRRSYIAWRERVSGRKAKHEKKINPIATETE